MNTVADVLEEKGRSLYRIDADVSVLDAVREMVNANVGSLLVTIDGQIEGIVTERDYLRRVTLEGRDERETPVREIMSSPLIVVRPETSLDECRSLMTERRIRHLPVVEGAEVVAVVSIGDIVKFATDQQSYEIRYLRDYIEAR
ncbi:MAG TPA: CBS domain-containing protein [Gaiellaceae bacterium]|jgi:signal-transduction protein with cAMP-binding, CBS, and nucleotidyltransferase domain|nr:CBS domain-containing protein [Gaiellaceae bacterium]